MATDAVVEDRNVPAALPELRRSGHRPMLSKLKSLEPSLIEFHAGGDHGDPPGPDGHSGHPSTGGHEDANPIY